jgi:hypothetical protein
MADNTRLNVGAGGDLIRTEDIGGSYKVPVSKIYLGAAGVNDGPVSAANPLPVSVQGALNVANTVTVQGSVVAQPATGVVASGGAALTPKYAPIAASAAGLNTLVAAVPGKKIRVLQYLLVTGTAVGVEFRSGPSTALTGSMSLPANGGVGAASSALGHFETASGQALGAFLSAAAPVSGHLCYIEV